MTQPAKSQEPSMEEILASIRRIIADDDANKTAPRAAEAAPPAARHAEPPQPPQPPAPAPSAAPPEASVEEAEAQPVAVADEPEPVSSVAADDQTSDILDLTESMASPMPPPAPEPNPEPSPMPDAAPQFRTIDGSFDVSYEEAAEKSAPHKEADEAPQPFASAGGYRGDERTQLISNSTSAAVDSAFNTLAQTVLVQNARTLEDLVREMLRPLLKSWLDDNLPGMVERLVRAEIERVSRGRIG
jgi:cell pole-organizing protein PopZ